MGRLFELLIALFLLIHIPITLFGDAQAGEEALYALKPVNCCPACAQEQVVPGPPHPLPRSAGPGMVSPTDAGRNERVPGHLS